MNTQSIQVTNSSNNNGIYLKFTPPENANIPEKESYIFISPGSTEKVAVQGGIMNLFIWDEINRGNMDKKITSDIIWKGVVPTKINKTLIIDPDGKKVIYDGMELPNNFQVTTSFFSKEISDNRISSTKNNWCNYFIVALIIVLIIMGIFYGLWYRGYFSLKKK